MPACLHLLAFITSAVQPLHAWLAGGGQNHRIGLYDMIMIKDNHIAAAGGFKQAVDLACTYVSQSERTIEIEVETRTLEEVQEAMECLAQDKNKFVTRIMLDNMAKRDNSCEGHVANA
jgi:nicotinate-nucleotide pyrophosphorylase (carboxylating)